MVKRDKRWPTAAGSYRRREKVLGRPATSSEAQGCDAESLPFTDELVRRCMKHAYRVYRELVMETHGATFQSLAAFLANTATRRRRWQVFSERLQRRDDDGGGTDICGDMPTPVRGPCRRFEFLVPCAVVSAQAHPNDFEDLLLLLKTTIEQTPPEGPEMTASGPYSTCVVLRARRHAVMADVVRDVHGAMVGARSVETGADARGEERPTRVDGGAAEMQVDDVRDAWLGLPEADRRPLVLMLEDPQALSTGLLEALLRWASELASCIPVRVVMMGMSAGGFGQELSPTAMEVLEPAHFTLTPTRACFEKLLERLFVNLELPVMPSGTVMRLLRVMFIEMHNSITTFFRHLLLLMYLHFDQKESYLCMVPYLMQRDEQHKRALPEAMESLLPPSKRMRSTQGAEDRLVVAKDTPDWREFEKLIFWDKMYLDLYSFLPPGAEATARAPSSVSPSGPEAANEPIVLASRNFRRLLKQQVCDRCALVFGCRLVHETLRQAVAWQAQSLASPSSSDPHVMSIQLVMEAVLDLDRPSRWKQIQAEIFKRTAAASLSDVDTLTKRWTQLTNDMTDLPDYRVESRWMQKWTAGLQDLRDLFWTLKKDDARSPGGNRPSPGAHPIHDGGAAAAAAAAPGAGAGIGYQAFGGGGGDRGGDGGAEEEKRRRLFSVKANGILDDADTFLESVMSDLTTIAAHATTNHKWIWFTDDQALHHRVLAEPRLQTVCDLARPGELLEQPRMKWTPDASIARRLYEEHDGRVLNTKAWFTAFAEAVIAEEHPDRSKLSKEAIHELMLRFMVAIIDLEASSFVRLAGNKVDRVKLVYVYSHVD